MKNGGRHSGTLRMLIGSALALVMCAGCLAGTTYAWFTDSASTGVNIIQAGNLDVELVGADGAAVTQDVSFGRYSEGAFVDTDVLFEPGATFQLPVMYVRNSGSLAAKYVLYLKKGDSVSDDAELFDVLEFKCEIEAAEGEEKAVAIATNKTTDGVLFTFSEALAAGETSGKITLTATMPADVTDASLMGKTLEGLTLLLDASQASVEADSYGTDYDDQAEFESAIDISNPDTLKKALSSAQAGETVSVVGEVNTDDDSNTNREYRISAGSTIDGNDETSITGEKSTVISGMTSTSETVVKNVDFENTGANNLNTSLIVDEANGNITISGCSFKNSKQGLKFNGCASNGDTNIVIENCTFYVSTNSARVLTITKKSGSTSNLNVTIKNCTFVVDEGCTNNATIMLENLELADVKVQGNMLEKANGQDNRLYVYMNNCTLNGSTLKNRSMSSDELQAFFATDEKNLGTVILAS